jgi:hypothetical protein
MNCLPDGVTCNSLNSILRTSADHRQLSDSSTHGAAILNFRLATNRKCSPVEKRSPQGNGRRKLLRAADSESAKKKLSY